MNPDKAIEIQTDYLNNPFLNFHQDFRDALKLSTEAMKWWRGYKIRTKAPKGTLLPGETDD